MRIVAISTACNVSAPIHLATCTYVRSGGLDEGETREGATGHTAASRTPLLHSCKAQGMLGEVLQPTEASATASDINHHREHRLEQGGCG